MAPGDQPTQPALRSRGRPRLHQPDAERDLVLKAALEVLRRNAGEEVTVAEILEQAGLSTRAFYRHFETKEDVIRSLYERDAESFGAHLRRRVEAADDPDEALASWVYELLGLAYDRRRAERVSALSSSMVWRIVAGTRVQRLGVDLLVLPLQSMLADAGAAGWFAAGQPQLDSLTILAITMEATRWARTETVKLSRREATDHVLRFARAALGTPS